MHVQLIENDGSEHGVKQSVEEVYVCQNLKKRPKKVSQCSQHGVKQSAEEVYVCHVPMQIPPQQRWIYRCTHSNSKVSQKVSHRQCSEKENLKINADPAAKMIYHTTCSN